MAIYDHACIREMVFIALLEGIQIDKLLFDESREEQARLQENIQLSVYLHMNEFQTTLLIDPKMISFSVSDACRSSDKWQRYVIHTMTQAKKANLKSL